MSAILPQEGGGDQLPQRPRHGDVLDLDMEGQPTRSVLLLAYDPEVSVWTVRDAGSGELLLIRIHEDLSWCHITIEEADEPFTG